jgi:hypothetical protein
MREGEHGDDCLIPFDEAEAVVATERYELARWLPGFKVLGLRGWDDFIVRNDSGQTYSIPTVPVDTRYLSPISVPGEESALDPRRPLLRKNEVVCGTNRVRWRPQY